MTVLKNRGPFLYCLHPVPNPWWRSKLQDIVDSLEGPTDCDVARPSIATNQSTILSTGRMVKVCSSLHWSIADLSEWINGTIGWARGTMHNYSTLGRQAEPKGGIEHATGRAMPWAPILPTGAHHHATDHLQ